jgi:hypothetical protein
LAPDSYGRVQRGDRPSPAGLQCLVTGRAALGPDPPVSLVTHLAGPGLFVDGMAGRLVVRL